MSRVGPAVVRSPPGRPQVSDALATGFGPAMSHVRGLTYVCGTAVSRVTETRLTRLKSVEGAVPNGEETLGGRLRRLRTEQLGRQFTQQQVAVAISTGGRSLSHSLISSWEND
jgi:hypothetical protein